MGDKLFSSHSPTQTVLIIEDDPVQATLARKLVEKTGRHAHISPTGQTGLAHLRDPHHAPIALILLDMLLPDTDGLTVMRQAMQSHPHLPVVFLTGVENTEKVVAAMRLGAFDYITKPFDPTRLSLTIDNALRFGALQRDVDRLKWHEGGTLHFTDLVGHNGDLSDAVEVGQRVASTNAPVLILGETGVGKEVFARALHGHSKRAQKPFIAINCGAIPENLIESILFGHERGAFTGATERALGKFREAEGGTIFLDEIGEMPPASQVRLLRVLQEGTVEPVGAARPTKIDVRIISATHRDLTTDITRGRFREDLYYRLNVVPVTLPPLRHRPHDIGPLAIHFLARFGDELGRPGLVLSPAAIEALIEHPWPGNVRQLENTLRRAAILTDHAELTSDDLDLTQIIPTQEIQLPITTKSTQEHVSLTHISLYDTTGALRPLADVESAVLYAALQAHHGNMTTTAKALGIAKSTLYRKLSKDMLHANL